LTTGEQVLEAGKQVIKELAPWDYAWVKDAELCDENAWLVGSFVPEVRQVVGTLPSGRNLIALGDTAQSLDPIGGQGANNGNKMARNLVGCIVERENGAFDAEWMRQTFDRFWQRHRYIDMFNNTLLEPLTKAGQLLLIAQYGSTARKDDNRPQQKIADLFIDNFNDPMLLTEAFHDEAKAKETIRQAFGSVNGPLMKGRLGVVKGQLRQVLGMASGHPGTQVVSSAAGSNQAADAAPGLTPRQP
jgi:2-polyprenyl-6-methoxyphenol hydroxylase-like FAD-dependent oxidoreductase